jgi:hypothetical protein
MVTTIEINEVVERFKVKGYKRALGLTNDYLKDGDEAHELAHDVINQIENFKLGDSIKTLESKVDNLFDEIQSEYNYDEASHYEQEEAENIYGILKPYTEDLHNVLESNHEAIK